ncbi:SRPBCC family protein [Rhizobium sp. SIMBA_035]
MTQPSATHTTFTIERQLKAKPERAFRAWANPASKQTWFACHDGWATIEYRLDFRAGGSERNHTSDGEGLLHAYDAHYLDVVENARIVYAYEMKLGETRISASLATITFEPSAAGTRMLFTEQVVFLDGYPDDGLRRQGTEIGLDNFEAFLDREASGTH